MSTRAVCERLVVQRALARGAVLVYFPAGPAWWIERQARRQYAVSGDTYLALLPDLAWMGRAGPIPFGCYYYTLRGNA